MQNEIELKIMIEPENIESIKSWIDTQTILHQETNELINTYYDTPDLFFAKQKMGLRIREVNKHCEMTLKTKGNIIGGLHIRPEYNLDLETNKPDFKRFNHHFNLQFSDAERIHQTLEKVFSTDVTRTIWIIKYQDTEIEIALDLGWVENKWGRDPICEVELELKQGKLTELLHFLNKLPTLDGMYFSALSKAERGYFIGRDDKIAEKVKNLTACDPTLISESQKYQFEQNLADIIRILSQENKVLSAQFMALNNLTHLDWDKLQHYLKSNDYLIKNIQSMQSLYL